MRFILSITAILSLTSCTTVPLGDRVKLTPSERKNPPVEATFSLRIENYATYGTSWKMSDADASRLLKSALEASGEFRRVREAPSGADVHFDCNLKVSASTRASAVNSYSLLTAYLIPMWVKHGLALSTEIYYGGRLIKAYTFRETCRETHWLPLIAAAPFYTAERARRIAAENLVNRMLKDMRSEGLLPVTDPSAQSAPVAQRPLDVREAEKSTREQRVKERMAR